MKIELTGDQVEVIVREELIEARQYLLDVMEEPEYVEALSKVISYYSVPE